MTTDPSSSDPPLARQPRLDAASEVAGLHRFYATLLAEHQRPSVEASRSVLEAVFLAIVRARLTLAPPGSLLDEALVRFRGWVYRRALRPVKTVDLRYGVYLTTVLPTTSSLRRQSRQASRLADPASLRLFTTARPEDLKNLGLAVSSLTHQTYPHWSLDIVAHGLPASSGRILDEVVGGDGRVRWRPAGEKGREAARGGGPGSRVPYLGFLEPQTLLAPNALAQFVRAIESKPPPDLVFADEDRLDAQNRFDRPFFKPDWSPVMAVSTDLLGGFFLAMSDGAANAAIQDALDSGEAGWDHRFRFAREASRVLHIPETLFHRLPGQEAVRGAREDWDPTPGRTDALRRHLSRMGFPAAEVQTGLAGQPRAMWSPKRSRHVTIVIPTRDQVDIFRRCLDSLQRTSYEYFEVVVIDTGSEDPRAWELYQGHALRERLQVRRDPEAFNFGRVCNLGARMAGGDAILFLNNDTEALDADWLDRMVQWLDWPGVGIVGAKLLYPSGRLQHAGVIVGMGGMASHLFHGEPELVTTMFGSDQWYRELSAVTGACMLVDRAVFEGLGGFDEAFQLNYQDVDFCLRAREKGWKTVYTPDARLVHHEGLSHRRRIPRSDFERAHELWSRAGWLNGDPFFSPNLSYMSPVPEFRWSAHDNPAQLSRRLIRRLPRKEILQLPDDLR